jgi:hypothetical protein
MPNDRPHFAVPSQLGLQYFELGRNDSSWGFLVPQHSAIPSPKAKPPTGPHFAQCPAGGLKRPQVPCTEAVLLGHLLWQIRTPPKTHNAPKLNNAWWRCTRTENCNPPVPLCRARSGKGSTGRERFTGRQLRLDCAWRCRAQGTPGWETSPPPSGVLLGGLSKYPRAGAVSLTLGAGELG